MIRMEGLGKVYGRGARAVTALADISLNLEPGAWGVVGPNGAGKTTLLGLILGFLRPTAGHVTVGRRAPRAYVRAHGAGYLPERFRLPAAWPVRSALQALARLDGHRGGAVRDRTEAALARMGLEAHADRPVGTLSRGLAQRVGLAQALLSDRQLVVLDEPTEGLDPLWRVRFRDLVTQLRDDDRTILLASHDLAEVERLADRVIVIDDGRVREVMDAHPTADGPLRYRLITDADPQAVQAAFPEATSEPAPERSPEATAEADSERSEKPGGRGLTASAYLVSVPDARELSHRLAALLAEGATVHGVAPIGEGLEARVRERLEDR